MGSTMPSFMDSGFIVILALMLFGPKKLPVLARQLGKLMADFRRASNEFRTQMEEELRISEQSDRQKQIAAIEAAAPPTPAIEAGSETAHLPPPEPTLDEPRYESQYESEYKSEYESQHDPSIASAIDPDPVMAESPPHAPLPIATSGDLSIMPPATGLPVANTSLSPFLDSIPEIAAPEAAAHEIPNHSIGAHEPALESESPVHG